MSVLDFPRIRQELEVHLQARTGNRVRNLAIMLSPDGVLLNGETTTFYVKQLAQHSIREILPDVKLQNDISVL